MKNKVIAITGKLESSHLHISMDLNLLVHVSAESPPGRTIVAAAAYSTSSAPPSMARIIIGDPLPLRFRVHWFEGAGLPSFARSRRGKTGGGVAGHTLLYCILSAAVGAAGCYAWAVGVDVPRRLRWVAMGTGTGAGMGMGMGMRARGKGDGGGSGANGGIIGGFGGAAKVGYGGYGYPGNGNGNSVSGGGYGYVPKRRD